ncbi:MAG: hypothetical protein H6766_01810 [Candidatus Peribacteria bacterium]|nr:MAG: hypothetical protein H6766_01810 [Candidatus Peribacteria bacterium]
MMLTTENDGIVGIKSTVLDLSSYRGKDAIVRGMVVDVVNNVPVVDVVSLVTSDDDLSVETQAQYVSAAGLILDPSKLGDYDVVSVDSDSITFSTPGGEEVVMSYFDCTDGQSATTGCAYIIGQFDGVESRFTGADGDERVQLPETNAWFGSNDSRIGYRIPEVDKVVVTDIMNGVTFINDRYVSRYLTTPAKEACQTIDHTMSYVSNTDIDYNSSDSITLSLEGTDTEGNDVSCEVNVDPRTRTAELVSIDGEAATDTEDDTDTTDESDDTDDATTNTGSSAGPAPTMGTELPFVSSKGYTIIFPSTNISFQGVNNTDSLGIEGVSGCWSQMNVVAFSNAAQVIDNPAIIMYDCAYVEDTIGSLSGYIRKDGTDSDRHFFIKVVNPEWTAFANAIKVK